MVVVGAGAAGLAAGRRLARAGVDVLVVEARDRVGGRAHTVSPRPDLALDLGCGWLHSGDVSPWTRIAGALGCRIDRTPTGWGHLDDGAVQEDWDRASAAFYERLDRLGQNEPGRPASEALEPGCRWNPLFDAISSFVSAAYLRDVSAHDLGRYADTGVNWRVAEGYGALVARYGRDVPLALSTKVHAVDHSGPRVRVETDRGTLTCAAAIVAVPTPILAGEEVRFRPALPDKAAAAADLPLGLANKLFLALDDGPRQERPLDRRQFGSLERAATGTYRMHPFGQAAVECYYGAGLAKDLEAAGPEATLAFALDEMAGIFGAGIRRHLRPITSTAWGRDPFARGSYSYAVPGRADSRAILAAPVDGRLFFAGEACSRESYSTAHGAYLTGRRAAGEALRALLGG